MSKHRRLLIDRFITVYSVVGFISGFKRKEKKRKEKRKNKFS